MITHNEIQYARVSEILAGISDYSGIDVGVLENKARIGTNVHQAIKDYLDDDIPLLAYDEKNYFESFLKWQTALSPTFLEKEKRLFHDDLRVTGQIDTLAFLDSRKLPLLVDYKTAAREMPSWYMQAHFYYLLLEHNRYNIDKRVVFLILSKSGAYPYACSYDIKPDVLQLCATMARQFWAKHYIC